MANSPILAIPQVAENQLSKHVTINNGVNALEKASNGNFQADLTAADVTLTEAQFTGAFLFVGINNAVARTLFFPVTVGGLPSQRFLAVQNTGTAILTINTVGGGGPSATVAIGAVRFFYVISTALIPLN
jgi:hypothetical protein